MVDLPVELKQALATVAREGGRDETEIVREALDQFLRARARPQPQSMGIVDDPGLDGADTENWLRTNWRRN